MHRSSLRCADAPAPLRIALAVLLMAGAGAAGAASATATSPSSALRAAPSGSSPVAAEARPASRADTTDIVDHVSDVTLTIRPGGEALEVPYYANGELGATYPGLTRAVVVLHGTLRNADEYQQAAVEAGALSGGADSTSFIITPQFLTEADIEAHDLPSSYLFWAYMGWRQGDESLNTLAHPRPAVISSFAVVDTIIVRLRATLPDLQRIVVAGHSAGGQFANRYAAGTGIEMPEGGGLAVGRRFVVCNPSTYLYFNDERWVQGTTYEFAVPPPEVIADCSGYDDYKYGLVDPNPYMSVGSDSLRARFARREVVCLLGQLDVNPNDFYLDRTCPAMLQGDYRLERGLVYANFLTHFFGEQIWDHQALAVIPGVGHDHTGIFTSACGRYYLFDYGSCASPPPTAWEEATPDLLLAPTCHAVAWDDFDGDGRNDLFLPAEDDADLLARNEGDGLFSDATGPPLIQPGQAMSAKWGDYDNDGLPDLYLVQWRSANRLFHNDGGGGFTDVTSGALGLDGDCTDAAWADYDNDGDLDLYITRMNNQSCVLLQNEGGGEFADVSAAPVNVSGTVRCAAWGDYDDDGDLDLYLAKDGSNRLFRNDGDGAFTDATAGPLGDNGGGASACWGDYDNDGDLDLYVVNRNYQNRLLRNDGEGFSLIFMSPVNETHYGRSAAWGDYDNDGWLDLYLCNSGGSNRLFHNNGSGNFTSIDSVPLNLDDTSYSAAWSDYDGDGALDLYVAVDGNANHLFHNGSAVGRHWLQVKLIGTDSNAGALGARLRLFCEGMWQTREIGTGAGAMAQNAPEACFGLDQAEQADSLIIRWPSGRIQRFWSLAADFAITIEEADYPSVVAAEPRPPAAALSAFPNPFRGGTSLSLTLSRPGPYALRLFDAGGRLVRSIQGSAPDAGRVIVAWDGRDGSGHDLPAGIYLARLAAAGTAGRTRLLRVR